MNKINRFYYPSKFKNAKLSLFGLFFLLLVNNQSSWGQQIIGQFPTLDGSFESNATPIFTTVATTSNTPRSTWGPVTSKSTLTISNTAPFARSGNYYSNSAISSSTNYFFTPTASIGAINASTSYVVQFFGWKNQTSSARGISVSITPDVTFGTPVSVGSIVGTASANAISTEWAKYSAVVTSGAGSEILGTVKLTGSGGGSFSNVLIDDFCMYAGTSVDSTPPPSATAATTSILGTTANVSWTASSDVDGGGYLVIRYSSLPNADNDPNQNGIYSIGNTINNGTGSLIGTVVYIGTSTSFIDIPDNSVPLCYYKIYTVDKAFNYSDEIQPTLAINDLSFSENNVFIYKNSETFTVNSSEAISKIEVFDIQGRLILVQKNINANSAIIKDLNNIKQVLIVKITSQDNKIVIKKVV